MNPWLIIAVIGAGIVFLLDYLLRRKKWADNTKTERTSLIVHMVSVPLYVFLSIFGLLWGIVAYSPDTAFGEALYDVTMTLGGYYWIAAAAAAIGSFIFRKIGKPNHMSTPHLLPKAALNAKNTLSEFGRVLDSAVFTILKICGFVVFFV